MTVWLWWHPGRGVAFKKDFDCPYVHAAKFEPLDVRPTMCTCVDRKHRPLPGVWREFREVEG